MQTDSPSTDARTDDLRTLLGSEHELLSARFEDIVDAFDTNNTAWCAEAFGELEHALEAHMLLEEREILPGFEKVDADEARALRAEHERIRSQLRALDVRVDLHVARADEIRALIERIRAHAHREDALAYRWADVNLEPTAHARLRSDARQRIAALIQHGRERWDAQRAT